MTINKEELLVELQSKFRKHIKTEGLIYMGLYELVKEERRVTPEELAKAIFAPLSFVKEYEYIYSIYI
ncbi:MAG: hypothetical protein WBM86_24155 [Waterburya sp.]